MNGQSNRPRMWEERYRLYVDESGDHVFKHLDDPSHRYLCLLGIWFKGPSYRTFHSRLDEFKQRHFPHSPDEPVILHREDIINRRGPFGRLREPAREDLFNKELLALIAEAEYRIVGVVIDKKMLRDRYPTTAHPYHLALGFLLQRYCGYLNHVNRCGDVLAESRGGTEDRLLEDSYSRVYEHGVWMNRAHFFREALTTKELKVKPKTANIAGLQLADLLGHPVRQAILQEEGRIQGPLGPFAEKLLSALKNKFNKQLYEERIEGYGKVLFPK